MHVLLFSAHTRKAKTDLTTNVCACAMPACSLASGENKFDMAQGAESLIKHNY